MTYQLTPTKWLAITEPGEPLRRCLCESEAEAQAVLAQWRRGDFSRGVAR